MKISNVVLMALMLAAPIAAGAKEATKVEKIHKTEAEWKKILSPEVYRIMRTQGTEIACSGEYWQNKADGVYRCAACDLDIFDSKDKFESKSGWPSFMRSIGDHVTEKSDTSFGMVRTEINCARCDGHLGHVFEDGPRPTGLRYCLNSLALKFVPREQIKTHP